MSRLPILFAAALSLAAAPASAKEREIITPLAEGLVAANHVVAVEVSVSELAATKMVAFETKAAEKRVAEKRAAVDPATPLAERPAAEDYDTLPFNHMFPLVMQDVTREWGLEGGRAIKLKVTIDTIKTANAAAAMLIGSADQLAGMVEVLDPASGDKLGAFYIDVINSHGGLLGLAARGSGVRESLSEEFALQTSRVLTGRKSKKAKAVKVNKA